MIPVSSTNLSSIPNELFRENLGFSGVGGVLRLRRIQLETPQLTVPDNVVTVERTQVSPTLEGDGRGRWGMETLEK